MRINALVAAAGGGACQRTRASVRPIRVAVLDCIVERLAEFGIETFGLDLTRPGFDVPVARVIAPGLQLEPSEIITPRLAEMIARTGGGVTYTGGVALV